MDRIFAQLALLLSRIGVCHVVTTAVSPTVPSIPLESHAASSLTLAEALLEGLVTISIEQFYAMMEQCVELALSGGKSFAFLRPLLENNVENIRRVGSSERAKHTRYESLYSAKS